MVNTAIMIALMPKRAAITIMQHRIRTICLQVLGIFGAVFIYFRTGQCFRPVNRPTLIIPPFFMSTTYRSCLYSLYPFVSNHFNNKHLFKYLM